MPPSPHETKDPVPSGPIDQEMAQRSKDLHRLQTSSLNPHQQNLDINVNSLEELMVPQQRVHQQQPQAQTPAASSPSEAEAAVDIGEDHEMTQPQQQEQEQEHEQEDQDQEQEHDQERAVDEDPEESNSVQTPNSDINSDTSGDDALGPLRSKEGALCDPDMQSVIFFDWDDTLLASSFLFSKGFRLDTDITCDETVAQLKELERSVVGVITLALRFGAVHVITNAETGWVQLSAQKFLPAVVPLLSRVKVVSARSTFEERHPQAPLKWKFCAFQESLTIVSECKSTKNIISFGDSHVEREAVRAATRTLANSRTKSVKFAERPSMEQLRRQIELVTKCFHYIFHHDGDLDLMLTISLLN
jgi:hypothetical protein